jgi:spore coat polysaccharide biosynthesis protein SpsF (cytidylyltransferase family)
MKIACLLSARCKATRLPGKSTIDILGKPLTLQLLNRLSKAHGICDVILSTSTHPDDEEIIKIAKDNGYKFFAGSEDDKLDRYYHTAKKFGLDGIIVVDGDDLFCFIESIEAISLELKEDNFDCITTKNLPLGASGTGLTTKALEKVLKIKDGTNTEVWGGYFFDNQHFNSKLISLNDPLLEHNNVRLTLDYDEDYRFSISALKELKSGIDFSSHELMDLLINKKPELQLINTKAQVMYEAHLEKSTEVKFKDVSEAQL